MSPPNGEKGDTEMNGLTWIDDCGRLYEVCWNCRNLIQVTRTDLAVDFHHGRRTRFDKITGSRRTEVVQQRLDAYALKHGLVAYPDVVCDDCARRIGKTWPTGHIATFYTSECNVCGIIKVVTECRDWGYLKTIEELKALHRVVHEGG
jgi:hypothetical protein